MEAYELRDEISAGPPERPGRRPPPWMFWLVVAAVAAGVVGVALAQRHDTTTTAPAPSPSIRMFGRVRIDTVCDVSVDRDLLTVSFTLVNGTNWPVDLLAVEPDPVLPGLLALGATTKQGTCGQPGPARTPETTNPLAPGGSVLVTFEFTVPAGSCPRPVPVAASLRLRVGAAESDSSLPVLNDLGAATFAGCASG